MKWDIRNFLIVSNCDVGVTNNDGINITTREVLDITDEVKLKDASVRVYDNVSVLTGSITSVPGTLLSLSYTLVLFPIELNLTQILSLPLETALTLYSSLHKHSYQLYH